MISITEETTPSAEKYLRIQAPTYERSIIRYKCSLRYDDFSKVFRIKVGDLQPLSFNRGQIALPVSVNDADLYNKLVELLMVDDTAPSGLTVPAGTVTGQTIRWNEDIPTPAWKISETAFVVVPIDPTIDLFTGSFDLGGQIWAGAFFIDDVFENFTFAGALPDDPAHPALLWSMNTATGEESKVEVVQGRVYAYHVNPSNLYKSEVSVEDDQITTRGAQFVEKRVITTSQALNPYDYFVVMNGSGITLTLPTNPNSAYAVSDSRELVIRNIHSSVCFIDPNGKTLDGLTTAYPIWPNETVILRWYSEINTWLLISSGSNSRRVKQLEGEITTAAVGANTVFTIPLEVNGSATINMLVNVKNKPLGFEGEHWSSRCLGGGYRAAAGVAVVQGGGSGWNEVVRNNMTPDVDFRLQASGNNLIVTFDGNSTETRRAIFSGTVILDA